AILGPLLDLEPEIAMVGPMAPVALSRMHQDPEHPVPFLSTTRTLADLPAEAIDTILAVIGPGSPLLMVELRHLGGALAPRPPEVYARLRAVKAQVDPDDVIRSNHPIPPAR